MTARDLIKELQAETEAQHGAALIVGWVCGDHNCVAFSGDVMQVMRALGNVIDSLHGDLQERGLIHGDTDSEI